MCTRGRCLRAGAVEAAVAALAPGPGALPAIVPAPRRAYNRAALGALRAGARLCFAPRRRWCTRRGGGSSECIWLTRRAGRAELVPVVMGALRTRPEGMDHDSYHIAIESVLCACVRRPGVFQVLPLRRAAVALANVRKLVKLAADAVAGGVSLQSGEHE